MDSRSFSAQLRLRLTQLMVALLLAVLGVSGWLQARQFSALTATDSHQDDYLVWTLFQFETESLRLRLALQEAASEPARADPDAVAQRYEIFISRLNLLEDEHATQVLQDLPSYRQTLDRVQAFKLWADALPLDSRLVREQPERLREVQERLDALADPIRSLSITATQYVAAQVTERDRQVQEHGRANLWLSVLQIGLALVLISVVLGLVRRIRRHVQQQQALVDSLHRAQERAEAGSLAKSRFLANMSHELRTPMHGLLGMLSLLGDSTLNRTQRQQLQSASDAAQHLLALLNDVLDLSTLESGEVLLRKEPTDLDALLRELEKQCAPQARAKGLNLRWRRDADAPGWVMADPTRLRQILLNLLSNAIKFSDQGEISLRVSRQLDALGRDLLRFELSDTGIGMDAQTLSGLFQRFALGNASPSRRHGGSGLGLDISRQLARAMGGDIEVQSRLGQGSVFTAWLQLSECEPTVEQEAARSPDTVPLAILRQLRVLVSEDNPTNQQFLAAVLEKLGHRAVICDNGAEALEALQAQDFDLVLMDLHTPQMDGYQAARAMRELPAPKGQVRIIAVSADAFEATRRQALDAGIDEFLAKPLGADALAQALRRQAWEAVDPLPAASTPSTQPAEPATAPDLDPATLADLRRHLSEDSVRRLFQRFDEGIPAAEQRLDIAGRDENRDELLALAHELKGAAANLGLLVVSRPALQLEQSLRREHISPQEVQALTAPLRAALQRAHEICLQEGRSFAAD